MAPTTTVGIVKGAGLAPEDAVPPPDEGHTGFGHQHLSVQVDETVLPGRIFIPAEDEIDQNRPPLAVEGQGVFVIALADHLSGLEARHLFDGPVPGDDSAFPVDGQGGVGKELDDLRQAPLRFPQGRFGLSALGDVFHDPFVKDDPAVGGADAPGVQGQPDLRAVFAPGAEFEPLDAAVPCRQVLEERAIRGIRVKPAFEVRDRTEGLFGGFITQHPAKGGIDVQKPSIGTAPEKAFRGILKKIPVCLPGFLQASTVFFRGLGPAFPVGAFPAQRLDLRAAILAFSMETGAGLFLLEHTLSRSSLSGGGAP